MEMVAALAVAPWAQPLRLRPAPGWRTGSSGTFASSYGPAPGMASPKKSSVYLGAPPTPAMRTLAQRALDHLELPRPRA